MLLAAKEPTHVHEQSQLRKIRCLECHIQHRKLYPPAACIKLNAKKQSVQQQRYGNKEQQFRYTGIQGVVDPMCPVNDQ